MLLISDPPVIDVSPKLKETLLSILVEKYDAYDKLSRIQTITELVDDIFNLYTMKYISTYYKLDKQYDPHCIS